VVAAGRKPRDLKFFQGLHFVMGGTEEEARRKEAELDGSYTEFVDHVIPVLQSRGLAQREYAPGTTRAKLFGADLLSESHPARGGAGSRTGAFPWGRGAPDAVGLRGTHGVFAALGNDRAVTADPFGSFLIHATIPPRRVLGKEDLRR
jgi:hypothetical protein